MTNQSDQFDQTLLRATDDAFWVEFNTLRNEEWEEGGVRRYIVRDGSKVIKVIVTNANLVKEKKIVV